MSEFQNVHKFELKAGVITTPHDEGMSFDRGSDAIAVTERETEFYLKSEVDKVIAGKDTKIIQLEALIENYNRISREIIDNANHHKYKRCLAMARWCASRSASWCFDPADEQLHKSEFYDKWKHRWLELAEKFKEAKNGND